MVSLPVTIVLTAVEGKEVFFCLKVNGYFGHALLSCFEGVVGSLFSDGVMAWPFPAILVGDVGSLMHLGSSYFK